jgi:hypothetical protein
MLLAVRLAVKFWALQIRELSLKYQEKMRRYPEKGQFRFRSVGLHQGALPPDTPQDLTAFAPQELGSSLGCASWGVLWAPARLAESTRNCYDDSDLTGG